MENSHSHAATMKEARDLVQTFARAHMREVEDESLSIVEGATILAIEAFGLAAAVYALETEVSIDEAISEYLEGMAEAGGILARDCHKFVKNAKAEDVAEKITAKIIADMQR